MVSNGIGCGEPGYPGIYTDVSQFNSWIKTCMASSAIRQEQIERPRVIGK